MSSGVRRVEGWKTSDGKIFSREHEAEAHQARLDLVNWCEEMFRGGSWRPKDIAEEIFNNWKVSKKPSSDDAAPSN